MEHLPTTLINVIPHKLQKYDTAGDYEESEGVWVTSISEMEDWRYEALVALHEFVEMVLTKNNGVDWALIDDFDKTGDGKNHPDPGMLKSAPYHNEHMLATQLEKKFAKMLGVDFEEYDNSFERLEYK